MTIISRWLRAAQARTAKLEEARFCEAYERYQTACKRGDTRAQHEAWGPLHKANTERLMREVWP